MGYNGYMLTNQTSEFDIWQSINWQVIIWQILEACEHVRST